MKLFTREEKRNEELLALYAKYISEGVKPTKAAKRAREEVSVKA